MKIISIKAGSEVCRVELSDGSFFSFKPCYLAAEYFPQAGGELAVGGELTSAEENALRFASACMRAEKAALRLIARAEQCCFGLAYKLQQRGHESACASAVVSRLASLEMVDDKRYAQLWLESRVGYTRSPRRLFASLCGRGIERGTAEAALKTVLDEETELSLLACFVEKRMKNAVNRKANRDYSVKYLLKAEGFSSLAIEKYFDGDV